MTKTTSDEIIIDFNPSFGWFEWQGESTEDITVSNYSKIDSKVNEKNPGITWRFNIDISPSKNFFQPVIIRIEILPEGPQSHYFPLTSTC